MHDAAMLGAVIVTYNRRDLLLDCLRANLAQLEPLDIVVVVDNASTDGTPEALEASGMLGDARVRYHRLSSNLGGAGGFSFGLQAAFDAGCEWIWLMDDDAIPEPDALKQLLEHLPKTEKPPVLASQVINAAGKTDTCHRSRMQQSFLCTDDVPLEEYEKDTFEADAATFVGPLFHRTHVGTCGLPRADFFIYYDDLEYTYRIRRAGYPLIVVPQSRINHLDALHIGVAAMRERSWDWRLYYKIRNRIYWIRQLGAKRILIIGYLIPLFRELLTDIVRYAPRKNARARLLFRAFWDGWRDNLGKTIDPASYAKPKA